MSECSMERCHREGIYLNAEQLAFVLQESGHEAAADIVWQWKRIAEETYDTVDTNGHLT